MDYPTEERLLFAYHDGTRERRADPLQLQQDLLELPDFNLELDCKMAGLPTPAGHQARSRVVAAVRHAFKVERYEQTPDGEKGLTQAECVDLLLRFAAYCQELQRRFFGPPTSPPSSAPGSSAADPLTSSSSPSSCSAPDSSSAVPTPSLSA